MTNDLTGLIFDLKDNASFTETALKIFRYQAEHNPVYKVFISSLGRRSNKIKSLNDIPFLPVGFFKSQNVIAENLPAEMIFESSRTTGTEPSRHFVHDLKIYEKSFLKSFTHFYGDPSEYFIAAILPSYTEHQGSSLVYMMKYLIKKSLNSDSGFYADNFGDLIRNINKAKSAGQKTFIIGVSFALLDFAEDCSPDLSGTIVMETGGMKGRRKEITREELHNILMQKLNLQTVHSEYGMTELMSQAYSKGNGIFNSPPWMRIMIRDPHDPLSVINEYDKAGGINIIDLANIYSCSFISTSDFGKLHENGGFEVSGRFDDSDIRGCNLMAE